MIQLTEKSNCTGCHACANSCPKNCIRMSADKEGFLYPEINQTGCIACGKCEKVCPTINHRTQDPDALQIGYAAYNKDEQTRSKSSSGGIFTLLAEHIIGIGGAVAGAVMSKDCRSVQHILVDSVDDLEKLRGSKYVQSTLGDTYTKVKQTLDIGRPVLFTGTPCQIGGLCSYLGKEYDNLYTQDLICHGVPSPLVWQKYVDLREKNLNTKVENMIFRNKRFGWKNYSVWFKFSDDSEYRKVFRDDPFMQGFLANIYLRPSCYNCAFKTTQRQSDITLADFWGIQKVLPEMDDDKGASFIWIHSEKGRDLLNSITEHIVCKPIQPSEAIKFNSAAVQSVPLPVKRQLFFDTIDRESIDKSIKKYSKKPIRTRIRRFLSRCKRKLLRR